MPDIEFSQSGGPIYRHETRRDDVEPAAADVLAHLAISEHLRRQIGPAGFLLSDSHDDLINIDLYIMRPTAEYNFYTAVTCGMSDRPMSAPEGADDYRYAELVLALPPTWTMHDPRLRMESNFWPLRWLKILARFPHIYDTWLFYMHTIPNGDPPIPYAENTDLCCALVSVPILFGQSFPQLTIHEDKTVHFYSYLPIYREEMDYKLQHGAERLLTRLERAGVSELLQLRRRNTCRKRRFFFLSGRR